MCVCICVCICAFTCVHVLVSVCMCVVVSHFHRKLPLLPKSSNEPWIPLINLKNHTGYGLTFDSNLYNTFCRNFMTLGLLLWKNDILNHINCYSTLWENSNLVKVPISAICLNCSNFPYNCWNSQLTYSKNFT